jgi:hypothetical protein
MRCFFHLVNGHDTLPDDTGIEVSDLDVAKAYARKAIGELQQEDDGAAADWRGWRLNIVCLEGSLLHSLPLQVDFH